MAFGINGCIAAWTPAGVEIREWLGRDRELKLVIAGGKARRIKVKGGSVSVFHVQEGKSPPS